MGVRLLGAALCGAFFIHMCLAAVVLRENEEKEAEGTAREGVNKSISVEVSELSYTEPTLNLSSAAKETTSSSESTSKKHNQGEKSSESNEDSSSSEEKIERKIKKRSLDSKQDPINSISQGLNETIKDSGLGRDDGAKTPNSNGEHTEENISTKDESGSTSTSQSPSTTTQDDSSLTPTTLETDSSSDDTTSTTTESASETVTESITETKESETTTGITESETTIETTPETTTENEIELTTEIINQPTTPNTVEIKPSTEDASENDTSDSSTPMTELESSEAKNKSEGTINTKVMSRLDKLSNQIRLVLENYRKTNVVVLPGPSFFPEPMLMQDFQRSFSVGTMNFKNMRVFGLNNFTVEHINTDVDRMQVYILLHMKRLVILGNYTLRTFFSRAAGPFNVTLLEVDSEGVAEIETASEGHLVAADSVMDMDTQDMKVDFKNLGFMGSMFQGMVSSVGNALFDSMKPQILDKVNDVIRNDVNKKLKDFSVKFINKISPVDLAVSEGRKYVRAQGYDPYHIKDHNFILGGLVYVNITEFWVEGLSKFYRVGNLSLSMDSGVIEISVHVATQRLTGSCSWSGDTFGIVKSGKTNFTIDHLQVRALVNQSLDIRKKPQLEDLDLELGWVKVTMDNSMSLNMLIEGIINAFPRLIRHIIVDTLEEPLKQRVQEILNKINVESVVDDNLPRLDSFGL